MIVHFAWPEQHFYCLFAGFLSISSGGNTCKANILRYGSIPGLKTGGYTPIRNFMSANCCIKDIAMYGSASQLLCYNHNLPNW